MGSPALKHVPFGFRQRGFSQVAKHLHRTGPAAQHRAVPDARRRHGHNASDGEVAFVDLDLSAGLNQGEPLAEVVAEFRDVCRFHGQVTRTSPQGSQNIDMASFMYIL